MGSISPSEATPAALPAYKTPWIQTPLVESAALSRAAGCRIFLKLENVQPSGSFKSRAMGNQILSHLSKPENVNRPVHFYASSGGNAGLAAVCAAQSLGYPCTVVVPVPTKPLMVQRLLTAGAADVILHGQTISEAGEYMRDVLMKDNASLGVGCGPNGNGVVKVALHPFDNEPIWEGNSTLVDELVTQLPPAVGEEESARYAHRAMPVDAIICSVGGGGLMNGIVMGIERRLLSRQAAHTKNTTSPIHIVAVETRGTDSLAAALEKGELVSLPKITSQATSLGVVRVSERTFQYAVNPPEGVKVHSTVLPDAEAARGVLRLVDDERILVELACGVCVEAAVGDAGRKPTKKRKRALDEGYGDDRSSSGENEAEEEATIGLAPSSSSSPPPLQSKLKQLVPELGPESRVVLVVCGGSNVTIDSAVEWRKMLQDGWGR
ncbi:hypothetical protein P175DRAFT_0437373 [Aspergillus ochraceoroseus IBT 24754]|uniref:L-serine ammonia-lyase n=1 Tax=Aspergillus ochraceoroseus IBT 24754 TaxID=1392256 RepID=A0A2T5LWS5_9EURO|nr:uncharacterized protein P175DRAFT_0437373 [Aspergillus ochraceoroseus IBT 24754]PTU20736.1 hypothetical protein P175DRAFT_0437373 [Aspergillus ochraceoroseus IBT 24754]